MSIYNYIVTNKDGVNKTSLSVYKDQVLLIVNTATGCGFTPQYKQLEELYQKYRDKGFQILDFPCNQFGHQAPGSNDEINQFCTLNYNTSFPRFGKIDVNGMNAIPLFKHLTMEKGFKGFDLNTELGLKLHGFLKSTDENYEKRPDIKWNFTKFLIGRDGQVIDRFEPTCDFAIIEKAIEAAL